MKQKQTGIKDDTKFHLPFIKISTLPAMARVRLKYKPSNILNVEIPIKTNEAANQDNQSSKWRRRIPKRLKRKRENEEQPSSFQRLKTTLLYQEGEQILNFIIKHLHLQYCVYFKEYNEQSMIIFQRK
jgi:hypothetical protein